MCGIAGIIDAHSFEKVSQFELRPMAKAMSYRGLDSEGVFTDGNIGLAHRRLAIIDHSTAGHQPMISKDGTVAVSFNGTIFNFPKLRDTLIKRGHVFSSKTDTEVLIHGWKEWGTDLILKLNGHFAFALWDSSKKKMYLARDRFGTKPLYYANISGLWIFASEIKPILTHPSISAEVNHNAVYEYFSYQNLFRDHTMFKHVHLLMPGTYFEIDSISGHFNQVTYKDYDFSHPDASMDLNEASEEVRRLLVTAVKRQLISDTPVGAYLSGGMDSGSIVSIASRELPRMNTFTCGWHMGGVHGVEASFDERLAAEALADKYKTEHYEQVVGYSDVRWAMPNLIFHLEDLRLGMCYGHYYISRLASKFNRVCLSGTGGDELFGGYPWRYYRFGQALGRDEYFSLYHSYWQRLLREEKKRDFFTASAIDKTTVTDSKAAMLEVFEKHTAMKFESQEDHIANSLYFEARTFLHGLLLVGDRLSMAHTLDERHPFLDNDLADFAQKIPVWMKLGRLGEWKPQDENILRKKTDYFKQHNDGKNILRDAMSTFVPSEVLMRSKQGFSSPDESWYRGPNFDYVRSLVLSPDALLHEYINPKAIKGIVKEHSSGTTNHRLLIWSLLSFEIWLKTFLNGEITIPEYQHTV